MSVPDTPFAGPLHNHEAGALEALQQMRGRELGQLELLAPIELQRVRQGLLYFRGLGRAKGGGIRHGGHRSR